MSSNIKFNPRYAYWEQAIQAQCDQNAQQQNLLEAFSGVSEVMTESRNYDYDALVDAFADLPEDEDDG